MAGQAKIAESLFFILLFAETRPPRLSEQARDGGQAPKSKMR
jgi:hypothetical protein